MRWIIYWRNTITQELAETVWYNKRQTDEYINRWNGAEGWKVIRVEIKEEKEEQ